VLDGVRQRGMQCQEDTFSLYRVNEHRQRCVTPLIDESDETRVCVDMREKNVFRQEDEISFGSLKAFLT